MNIISPVIESGEQVPFAFRKEQFVSMHVYYAEGAGKALECNLAIELMDGETLVFTEQHDIVYEVFTYILDVLRE